MRHGIYGRVGVKASVTRMVSVRRSLINGVPPRSWPQGEHDVNLLEATGRPAETVRVLALFLHPPNLAGYRLGPVEAKIPVNVATVSSLSKMALFHGGFFP